jgi:demethylmenaquinone methyltransferase/2-methoxy-6-polyprenyl-1,4-benzoquinol methylase
MPSRPELAVAGFYDGIYHFYEAANSFLTLGLDRYWRRRAAGKAREAFPGGCRALDVCCGTGDFALALKKAFGGGLELTGADLSEAMLSSAARKLPGVKLVKAEAKELPFPDGAFDLVTIAFATRNLNIDRDRLLAALREFRRVLKPGGLFLNLETTRPENPAVRFLMRVHVKTLIALLNLISPKSKTSYLFLRDTILGFYTVGEFSGLLREAGFSSVSGSALFPGAVAVHSGRA